MRGKKKDIKPFKGDEISAMKSNHRPFCLRGRPPKHSDPITKKWQNSSQQLPHVISNHRASSQRNKYSRYKGDTGGLGVMPSSQGSRGKLGHTLMKHS